MGWKYFLITSILAAIIGGNSSWIPEYPGNLNNSSPEEKVLIVHHFKDGEHFKDETMKFARTVAESYFTGEQVEYPEGLELSGIWDLSVTIYYQGKAESQGKSNNEILSLALEEAVKNALNEGLKEEELREARFLISFPTPPNNFSFIEYNGENIEVISETVIVRDLDKDLIQEKIKEGKEFLERMMNEEEYGFYKKYDAPNDSFEERLHTVYSSSIIYTFLYMYDLEKDEKILESLSNWGRFVLSMQNKKEGSEGYGAFHYSYYLNSKEKEQRFVVGTSALSIFTLLRMYDLTGDIEYLESAKLAGDWLTTMKKPDGSMKAYLKYSDGEWVSGDKESLLYNGQVLSSLSKLYSTTGEQKYYDAAKGIADHFAEKYEKEQGYVKGEYREKNPISNSWIVMSLKDFYKVESDSTDKLRYKNIIFELSGQVLKNQKNNPESPLKYGGWNGVYSSSGTGWINEVMTEMYMFCLEENEEDCEKYKEAVIKSTRFLVQSTYSEENSFFLPNPERAKGGVYWNGANRYVRTDSVCHALNGYTLILKYLEKGSLLSIPEPDFNVTLEKIRN